MIESTNTDRWSTMSPDDFCRRANYIHGHLDAVVRMVRENRDPAEVLHQIRAVRRATEKLEVKCLVSQLDSELEGISPDVWRTLGRLYRRLNK